MSRPEATSYRREEFLRGAGTLVAAAAAGPLVVAAQRARSAAAASHRGDPIAATAVDAAKKLRGSTLRKTTESGLRALDDKNFTALLWRKLTGIEVDVVEASPPQLYSKALAAQGAKSGALDVIEAWPAWIPDLADHGAIFPIDGLIGKYAAQASLRDYHPLYRSLMSYRGKTWGFYDDGDIWILFYRKDVFADRKLRAAYRAQFRRELRVPRTWDEFSETAQFVTDQLAPRVYGTGMGRVLGDPGNQFYFFQQFRANGGRFFDPKTMKALINGPIGVRTMNQILAQNKASIPGVEKLDFVTSWVHWLQGRTAMMVKWPVTARISENYAQRDSAWAFLPRSKIAGKVGYALGPGPALAPGAGAYLKCVSAGSKNREAAYLFTQWATSPSISLRRLQLPYTLNDPYRISHYRSQQFRNRWPAAGEYLQAVCEGANHGVLDLMITGAVDYATVLDRAMSAIYLGTDVKRGLDDVAAEWDALTRRLGVESQRRSYLNFLRHVGSTRTNTVAAQGLAATC